MTDHAHQTKQLYSPSDALTQPKQLSLVVVLVALAGLVVLKLWVTVRLLLGA